jgi:hypothetical protein
MGLLIIPGFLGCSNWTVSGDVLRVKAVPANSATTIGTGAASTEKTTAAATTTAEKKGVVDESIVPH